MILNYNRDHYCFNPTELKHKILEDVETYNPSVINVCAAEEIVVGWDSAGLEKIDVQINYLFGNVDQSWYKTTFNPRSFHSHNRKVEVWPTYFFKFTHYDQHQFYPQLFNLEFNDFKYPIMCLNKKMHNHRYQLIAKLNDYDLIKGNAISWLGIESPEYQGLNRVLPPIILTEVPNVNHETTIPLEWTQSFLHIVSESTLHARFITEKTAKCLFSNTFFIAWAAPKFHQALKQLGFELYDEIVDYSFDSIIDNDMRLEALIKEADRIVKQNKYKEMYNLIKPKLERNKQHAFELAYDPWYPKIIDEYGITFYNHLIR